MPNLLEVNEEQELEFSWGHKKCAGGPNNSVQFYDSFTYDGIKYFLYDCVYMWCDDLPEPCIGKLVKIWETASHKRRVKVVWFFLPIEVEHWLGDIKLAANEIFLASGEGKGLFNLNPLEAICGKCNVVCTSKDSRNFQPTEEDLRKADYIFYRTFDVRSCKISDNFANENAGVEVKHYFNLRKVQKSTPDTGYQVGQSGTISCKDSKAVPSLDGQKSYWDSRLTVASQFGRSGTVAGTALKMPTGNLVREGNSLIMDGTSARDKMKYSKISLSADVPNIQALKKRKLQSSSGSKPLSQPSEYKDSFVNSKGPFSENSNLAKGVSVNERASKEACQYGQSKDLQSYSQNIEVRSRLNTDSSKWFKLHSWEDRMYAADKKGSLVLLENLDPSYTSTEVEEIVLQAFNHQVCAKMIQHTIFSSPNCGKAFVIFKSKDAADSALSCLKKRCLIIDDRRPVVGCRKIPGDPCKPSKFLGHLNISKVRLQKQHADKRNAVSTSHFSQSNTVEYDMALQWGILNERSMLSWEALHKAQAKEMEFLRNQIKVHHHED